MEKKPFATREKLEEIVAEYDCVIAHRGKGLIQGLEVEGRPVGEIVNRALEHGLIIITAGSNVLRFVPPLVITNADVCLLYTSPSPRDCS